MDKEHLNRIRKYFHRWDPRVVHRTAIPCDECASLVMSDADSVHKHSKWHEELIEDL